MSVDVILTIIGTVLILTGLGFGFFMGKISAPELGTILTGLVSLLGGYLKNRKNKSETEVKDGKKRI